PYRPSVAIVLPSAPHGTFDLPRGVPSCQFLPLVIGSPASREGEFDLGLSVGEVKRQWYERQPALCRRPGKPVNLLAMQQQLPDPARLMVRPRALRVLGNVNAMQPYLTISNQSIPISEACSTLPE